MREAKRSPLIRYSLLSGVILATSGTLAAVPGQTTAKASAADGAKSAENYGKLPLAFEANQGQADPSVKFLSRGSGYSLFLTGSEAVLALGRADCKAIAEGHGGRPVACVAEQDSVRMKLTGAMARHAATATGEAELPGKVNYFIGNDPTRWHSDLPTYAKVRYSRVYSGIDLVYYGRQGQLEYDFVVAPGADPNHIRLSFTGERDLSIAANGDLVLQGEHGSAAFHKPVVYQEKDGHREPVAGNFRLMAKNVVGFALGSYDHARALVIDPVLVYSTYLGGSGKGDGANGIAIDSAGNAYLVGTALSTDFPVTAGAFQPTALGTMFVSKLNATGTALVYSTYLGGSVGDTGYGIALDSANNAYVTGLTYSSDFPVTCGAFQTMSSATTNGVFTGFVTKLNAAGNALAYSSYLGGSGNHSTSGFIPKLGDAAQAIAVDSSGNAYLTGYTYSSDFPVTAGAFQTVYKGDQSMSNTFVAKVNSTGAALTYATYLGGSGSGDGAGDFGNAIAIDAAGHAFVAGSTGSADFPVTAGVFQPTKNARENAFVTELNIAGAGEIYSTYLGGSTGDRAQVIALGSGGSVYVAGLTDSPDFPTTPGVVQPAGSFPGEPSAFAAKLSSGGTALQYSTFLEGQNTNVSGLAVDSAGAAYIVGNAGTANPGNFGGFVSTPDALPVPTSIGNSAFIVKLDPTAAFFNYATLLGGGGDDAATAVAVDASGNAYIAGSANSADFPVTSGAFQTAKGAPGSNAFIAKLALAGESNQTTYPAGPIATTMTVSGQISDVVCNDINGETYAICFGFTLTPAAAGPAPTGIVDLESGGEFEYDGPYNAYPDSTSQQHCYHQLLQDPKGPIYLNVSASYSGDPLYAGSSDSITVVDNTCPSDPSSGLKAARKHFQLSPTLRVPPNKAFQELMSQHRPHVSGPKFTIPSIAPGINGQESFAFAQASPGTSACIVSQAATPTFSPGAGAYTSSAVVAITDATPGATIYYAVHGVIPTTSSTKYTGPITVTSSQTIKAIAVAPSYTQSAVSSALYTIQQPAAAPVFKPAAGAYPAGLKVTITDATPGATIYYAVHGVIPTTSSTKYTGPITVPSSETIKAIAVASGYGQSAVVSALYTIQPTAATPVFKPIAGAYPAGLKVTITDATPGAVIYYAVHGAIPTTSSTKYTGAIAVSSSETIKAIAVANGYTPSAIASALYTIEPLAATPVFSLAGGAYTGTQTVKLTDSTPGTTIYYALHGVTPTTSSTVYTGSITVGSSETIKAIAVASGYSPSAVASATYTIH